jgi:hypothetical protein
VTELGGNAPASSLYVGNSFFYFNNGMGGHVSRLNATSKATKKLRSTDITLSGSSLQWHDVESYFRPNVVGAFSFDPRKSVVVNKLEKLFEVVVMMDCSQCPIHPALKTQFTEYARTDADIVRRHGGKPVLFMSWAYAGRPEMTAALAEAYTVAGNDNDALVIPAGLAFARVEGAARDQPLRRRQAASDPGRHLPCGVHDLRLAVSPFAGRPEVHGRPGRGDREAAAGGGPGDGAGILSALTLRRGRVTPVTRLPRRCRTA